MITLNSLTKSVTIFKKLLLTCFMSFAVFLSGAQTNDEFIQISYFEQPLLDNGLIAIEAENYATQVNGNLWETVALTGASGGKGVRVPDSGSNLSTVNLLLNPRLNYPVNFTQTGTYYVWVRGMANDSNSDSIHIGLDNTQYTESYHMSGFSPHNAFSWINSSIDGSIATIEVTSTGLHTLNVWQGEDGFVFDKVVLTRNIDYTPLTDGGSGPAETIRASGIKGTGILREWWLNLDGNELSTLTNAPNFPGNPDGQEQLTSFDAPTFWADHYGSKISGYLIAPETGDYTFWVSGDDSVELRLSSDVNPANATLIANVPNWTSHLNWQQYPEQQSAVISLQAGQAYYIEALHKESIDGDGISVGWQRPGNSLIEIISLEHFVLPNQLIQNVNSNLETYQLDTDKLVPNIGSIWQQDFSADTQGFESLPAHIRHENERLILYPEGSTNVSWLNGQREYDPGQPLAIKGEIMITDWADGGHLYFGARNNTESESHLIQLRSGQANVLWRENSQFRNQHLGSADLNTIYIVEVVINGTSSDLYIYEKGLSRADGYHHHRSVPAWSEIKTTIHTYARGLNGWLDNISETYGESQSDELYYLVEAGDTWTSIAQDLYGSIDIADQLQTLLATTGYTLVEGERILESDLPTSLSVTATPQDSDGDGVPDDQDAFLNDPTETQDSDGDGVGDNADAFPNDPHRTVNTVPIIINPITNQSAIQGSVYTFVVPANTFNDADGDSLTITGGIINNGSNSNWLSFDNTTQTFSGVPTIAGSWDVFLTAEDGNGGSVTDIFTLTITTAPALIDSDSDGISDSLDLYPNDANRSTGIWREWWLDIGTGFAVSDLTSLATFPNNPDGAVQLTSFAGPQDWGREYGARIHGIFYAPQSGEYTFEVAGDDNVQLWLSTDYQPSNKVQIASVPGWTSFGQWNKYPEQQSVPITLVADQAYYIEVLHKEGYGGDHVAVRWQRPDGVIEVLSGNYFMTASAPVDSDGDGVPDDQDAFPNDPTETQDSDNDDVGDNADAFPNDSTETIDTDGDSVGDNADAFPNDATETVDSDGDGVGDNVDAYPNDPTRSEVIAYSLTFSNPDMDFYNDFGWINSDNAIPDFSRDTFLINNYQSSDVLPENGDGWIQLMITGDSNNLRLVAESADPVFVISFTAEVDGSFRFSVRGEGVFISQEESIDALVFGDIIRIERQNGYIRLLKNNEVIATSNNQYFYELISRFKLIYAGDRFSGVVASYGTGAVWDGYIDTDNDGYEDDIDRFPNNFEESRDTDRDGVGDNTDIFPNNASETIDTDGDGVGDNADAFPNDPSEVVDSDYDGIGDNQDSDYDSYPLDYSILNGVSVSSDGTRLTGSEGFQSDFTSTDSLLPGQNGWVEFSIDDNITTATISALVFNKTENSNQKLRASYTNYLNGSLKLSFYTESGQYVGLGSFLSSAGDNFRLERRDGLFIVSQNGLPIYSIMDDENLVLNVIGTLALNRSIVNVVSSFGTGHQSIDTDGDGVPDNEDAFPNDLTETIDTDGDGVGDNADIYPNDPTRWDDSGVIDISITSPANNTTIIQGTSVTLTGTAQTRGGNDLSANITWSSNIDGALGTGATIAPTLTVGNHQITATAVSGSETGSAQINITVESNTITVTISTADNQILDLGQSLTLQASATDAQGTNLNDQIQWSADTVGLIDTGASLDVTLPVGLHTITASVANNGQQSQDLINVIVKQPLIVDTDGDGLSDAEEVQLGTNPNAVDSDGDGLNDLLERNSPILDPTNANDATADTDNDGIPNNYELLNGLDPQLNDANEDLDGDGLRNIVEYANNYPANDARPSITLLSQFEGARYYFNNMGDIVTLQAQATDQEEGDISARIQWHAYKTNGAHSYHEDQPIALGTGQVVNIDTALIDEHELESHRRLRVIASIVDQAGNGQDVEYIYLYHNSPASFRKRYPEPGRPYVFQQGTDNVRFGVGVSSRVNIEYSDVTLQSNIDGILQGGLGVVENVGEQYIINLSVGDHLITGRVTDNWGLTTEYTANVTVTANNEPGAAQRQIILDPNWPEPAAAKDSASDSIMQNYMASSATGEALIYQRNVQDINGFTPGFIDERYFIVTDINTGEEISRLARSANGGTLDFEQYFNEDDAAVFIGDYIVVGTNPFRSFVRVFNKNTGAYSHSLNNPSSQNFEQFGAHLQALSNNRIAVSAYEANNIISDGGVVYIFDVTNGNLLQTIHDPTPLASDRFGHHLYVTSDNNIAITSRSQVSLFNGNNYSPIFTVPLPYEDGFGNKTQLSSFNGNVVLAAKEEGVYILERNSGVQLAHINTYADSITTDANYLYIGESGSTVNNHLGMVKIFDDSEQQVDTIQFSPLLNLGTNDPAYNFASKLDILCDGRLLIADNGTSYDYANSEYPEDSPFSLHPKIRGRLTVFNPIALNQDQSTNNCAGNNNNTTVVSTPIEEDPGIVLVDTDNDGIPDAYDQFVNNAGEFQDTDGDSVGDNTDTTPYGDQSGENSESYNPTNTTEDSLVGKAFGAVEGNFKVQPNGSASYTIPIKILPGIAEVEPNIAININTHGGSDWLGRGASLSGFSVISRCHRTIVDDGINDGIDFDDNDAWCMDGQRLIVQNSTPGNVQENGNAYTGYTEYRTKINNFSRVVAYGDSDYAANNPLFFRVKTKAGETLTYGLYGNSRINLERPVHPLVERWLNLFGFGSDSPDRAITYALSKVEDAMGNSYTYHYQQSNNAYYPDYIEYTQNGSVDSGGRIQFNFESSYADPENARHTRYIHGYTTKRHTNNKLTSVVTYGRGQSAAQPYRQYNFLYNDSYLADTQLTAVQECAYNSSANNFDCLPSVKLGWNQAVSFSQMLPTGIIPDFAGADFENLRPIDFDNDGKSDMLELTKSKDKIGVRLWKKYENTFVDQGMILDFLDPVVSEKSSLQRYQFGDFNGDGYIDLLHIAGNLCFTRVRLWLNDLKGGLVKSNANNLPDIKPGKVCDISTTFFGQPIEGGYIDPHDDAELYTLHYLKGIYTFDVNSDGISDLVASGVGIDNQYYSLVWMGSESGNFSLARNSNFPVGHNEKLGNYLKMGDFNGDRLQDAYLITQLGNNDIYLNNGDGTFQKRTDTENTFPASSDDDTQFTNIQRYKTGDFNGDKLTDILYIDGSNSLTIKFFYSRGDGSFQEVLANETHFDGYPGIAANNEDARLTLNRYRVIDLNQDGLSDIHFINPAVRSSHLTNLGNSNFISRPRDGADTRIDFSTFESAYDDLATIHYGDYNGDGMIDVLQVGRGIFENTATKPMIEFITNHVDTNINLSYSYLTKFANTSAAIYTKQPFSQNGYSTATPSMQVITEVSVLDGVGGRSTSSYRYEDYVVNSRGYGPQGFKKVILTDEATQAVTETQYYTEYPYTGMTKEVVTKQADLLLSHSIHRATNLKTTGEDVDFPFIASSTTRQYHYDNNQTQQYITIDDISRGYDNTGNLFSTTTQKSGLGESYTTRTLNTYHTDPEWRRLGRLVDAQVTKQVNGQTDLVSTINTAYSYNSNGLLWKETIEPGGNSALTQTTMHEYDTFGNEIRTISCAADMDACNANHSTARIVSASYAANDADMVDGQYPTLTTNALGHQETTLYNTDLGVVREVIGPNGPNLATYWEHDAFGRVLRERARADQNMASTRREFCEGALSPCPSVSGLGNTSVQPYYKVTQASAGQPEVITYYDRLGRSLRISTFGYYDGGIHRINQDSVYDANGSMVQKSQPYFVGDPIYWTYTHYDLLRRPYRVLHPDTDESNVQSFDAVLTFYNEDKLNSGIRGIATTIQDSKGRFKTSIKNVAGQNVANIDAMGFVMRYAYDSQGNLSQTTDPSGNQIILVHDKLGRKVSMDDPDMGYWTYRYNAFGELLSQTDAKGITTTMAYDKLGRITHRDDDDNDNNAITDATATWTYDQGSNAIGKLSSQQGQGENKTFAYDNAGRLSQTQINISLEGSYIINQTYDDLSRPLEKTYPSEGINLVVRNHYHSPLGFLQRVTANGDNIWQVGNEGMNAKGQLLHAVYGNGVEDRFAYLDTHGWLRQVVTNNGLQLHQNLNLEFDSVGNLKSRVDFALGTGANEIRERFSYDKLDRLKASGITRPAIPDAVYPGTHTAYNALGNIISKAGVGTYRYGSECDSAYRAGPHAVCRIDNPGGTVKYHLQHDANGNQTYKYDAAGGLLREVRYNSFNKPEYVAANNITAQFSYDSDRMRFRKVETKNGQTERTLYIGMTNTGQKLMERISIDGTNEVKYHYFININGKIVNTISVTKQGNTTTDTQSRYNHYDHLGSVTLTSDVNGNKVDENSFDSWGQARNANNWSQSSTPLAVTNPGRLGYTGHETLNGLGMIHMNARLYDSELGRFLSADTFIQLDADLQSFNRYTYVMNNPLKYNDPSGHFFFFAAGFLLGAAAAYHIAQEISPELSQIISIGLNFVPGVGPLLSAAWSSVYAYANGASFGQALFQFAVSYASQQAFGELHDWAPTGFGEHLTKAITHGLVGGTQSALLGGDFKDGFTGAFVSYGFSNIHNSNGENLYQQLGGTESAKGFGNWSKNVALSAVIGGTASHLSGGKFANGARAGMYSRMFNELNALDNSDRISEGEGYHHNDLKDGSRNSDIFIDPKDLVKNELLTEAYFIDKFAVDIVNSLKNRPLIFSEHINVLSSDLMNLESSMRQRIYQRADELYYQERILEKTLQERSNTFRF